MMSFKRKGQENRKLSYVCCIVFRRMRDYVNCKFVTYLRGGEPALGPREVREHSCGLDDDGHEEVGERRQETSLVDAVVENVCEESDSCFKLGWKNR